MSFPLILISGPTASGKTELAVRLALSVGGEIISADSMQVFRGFEIGTAQPSVEQLQGVDCHLTGCLEPSALWTVADWYRESRKLVEAIQQRGKIPIIVGGTGLYFKTLDGGLFQVPDAFDKQDIRQELEDCWDQGGAEELREELCRVDKDSYRRIHCNDRLRIVRALEVFRGTGRSLSDWQQTAREHHVSPQALRFVLSGERAELYRRIDRRVLDMVRIGFADEVRALLESGADASWSSMRALGYPQMREWLEGQCSRDSAVSRTQQLSRKYAKRQFVLLRQWAGSVWLDNSDGLKKNVEVVEKILELERQDRL